MTSERLLYVNLGTTTFDNNIIVESSSYAHRSTEDARQDHGDDGLIRTVLEDRPKRCPFMTRTTRRVKLTKEPLAM